MKKTAVILAGGRSLRFGTNKAFARLKGITLLERAEHNLKTAGFHVTVADGSADPFPKQGPLQALVGIGRSLKPRKILLVPCDMPLLKPELLTLLWKKSVGFDVTVIGTAGRIAPLPGVYSARAMEEAGRLFKKGRRDLKSLMETELKIRKVDWDDLTSLANINTPRDLREVRQCLAF